jgi:nitrile hydratase
MDGVHDMGGLDGFGKVEPEPDEPPFHARWEGRVLALQRSLAYARAWSIDTFRYAQERLHPLVYLGASYYQRWAVGMEHQLLDRGYVREDELTDGHARQGGKHFERKLTPSVANEALGRGSYYRQMQAPARFKIGDRVRARNIHPATHTRLPRYVRGHVGTVELIHGSHAFPDSVATEAGDSPQWLYTVVFDGRELWGPGADATVKVSVDAFEPYLEPA